jgi:hypothetical protein
MLIANRVSWQPCDGREPLEATEIWTQNRDAVLRIECVVTGAAEDG